MIVKFNFLGKLLGPKGQILKQLESETKCKILIRGRGSNRNKIRDSSKNFSEEKLHILLTTEGEFCSAIELMNNALIKIRPYLEPDIVFFVLFGYIYLRMRMNIFLH